MEALGGQRRRSLLVAVAQEPVARPLPLRSDGAHSTDSGRCPPRPQALVGPSCWGGWRRTPWGGGTGWPVHLSVPGTGSPVLAPDVLYPGKSQIDYDAKDATLGVGWEPLFSRQRPRWESPLGLMWPCVLGQGLCPAGVRMIGIDSPPAAMEPWKHTTAFPAWRALVLCLMPSHAHLEQGRNNSAKFSHSSSQHNFSSGDVWSPQGCSGVKLYTFL